MTQEHKNQEEFSDDYVPQSNWMAFDNVGEYIRGTLTEVFYKEGQGTMPDQWVYVLKNVDGECERLGLSGKADDKQDSFNVGIKKDNSFINSRMKKAKLGQRVGFKFNEEIPPKTKGYNPAKSIKPYIWDFDPDYDNLAEQPESMESQDQESNIDDIQFE